MTRSLQRPAAINHRLGDERQTSQGLLISTFTAPQQLLTPAILLSVLQTEQKVPLKA